LQHCAVQFVKKRKAMINIIGTKNARSGYRQTGSDQTSSCSAAGPPPA